MRLTAAAAHGGTALALAAAAAMPPGLPRVFLFMAFAGVTPALWLRRNWSISLLPAVAVVMALAVAMLLAGASFAIPVRATLWLPCGVSALAAAGALLSRRQPHIRVCASRVDGAALLLMLVVALAAGGVMATNGPVRDAAGAPAYLARGWYASDSLYLFALSQHAADANAYPGVNPFMPGTPNAYPSLIHCGLGWLARIAGAPASTGVWALHPLFAAFAAALLVHAVGGRGLLRRGTGRRTVVLTTLGSAAFLALRPDLVVFPQTHAFALPLFLLVLWLTGLPPSRIPARNQWTAVVITAMLVFAHTVTSVVAIALLATHAATMRRRSPGRVHAALAASAVVALVLLFAAVSSATAPTTPWVLNPMAFRFAGNIPTDWLPVLAALALAVVALPPRHRMALVPALVAAALGSAYAIRGLMTPDAYGAWFALFNAPRFWHFAALLTLPVLPLIHRGRAAAGIVGLLAMAVVLPWLLPAPRSPMAVSTRAMQAGTLQLFVGPPEVTPAGLIDAVSELRRLSDPRDPVLSDRGKWVAALSGRPSFTADPVNLWAHGTMSSEDYAAALDGHTAAFASPDPAALAAHMNAQDARWLVAGCSTPPGKTLCAQDDGDATSPLARITSAPGWNLFRLR